MPTSKRCHQDLNLVTYIKNVNNCMSPTLLLISHQNLTLNLGSWLWKCFFKSNDAFNAETKIIQSFCEIDSESKSWWFVFWLKIKPYSTILFHWKITVSLCGSSKSCRVTVNGNDSLNKSRDNEFHILSSNGKFNWKLIVLEAPSWSCFW